MPDRARHLDRIGLHLSVVAAALIAQTVASFIQHPAANLVESAAAVVMAVCVVLAGRSLNQARRPPRHAHWPTHTNLS